MRSLAPLLILAVLTGAATPSSADAPKFDPAWLGQPFAAVIGKTGAAWRTNDGPFRASNPWIAARYASWAAITFDASLYGERGTVDAMVFNSEIDKDADSCKADYLALLAALEKDYGAFQWRRRSPDDEIVRVGEKSESLLDRTASGYVGRAQSIWTNDGRNTLIDLHGEHLEGSCQFVIAFSEAKRD